MDKTVDELIKKIKTSDDFLYKAKLIQYLVKEKGVRLTEISKKAGIKPSYLSHIYRLNRLPSIIIDGYYGKNISISHLFTLSRIKNEKSIIKIYEKILSKNLSVSKTEELVRDALYNVKSKGKYLNMQEKQRYAMKIIKNNPKFKLNIIQTRTHGKLEIRVDGNLKTTTSQLKKMLNKLSK